MTKKIEVDINSIKARLGSIPPSVRERMSPAIQKVLSSDMPTLINYYEVKSAKRRPRVIAEQVSSKDVHSASN